MEIRGNLKQVAVAKEKNYRTVKKMIGGDIEEVWRTNKLGNRELVGYIEAREKVIVVKEEEYLRNKE